MNLFLNGFSCVRKATPCSFSPGTLYPICLQEETDKKRMFWSFVETSGSDQDGITRTGCVLLPEASKITKTDKYWSRKWQPPPVVLPGSPMDRGAWWSCLWVSSVSLLYSSVAASMPWFIYFWPHLLTCGILLTLPGIKPKSPALEAWSPNHWTTREIPRVFITMVLQYG